MMGQLKKRAVRSFATAFAITLIMVGLFISSYIIIERGESALKGGEVEAIAVIPSDNGKLNLAFMGNSINIDFSKISAKMDKLKGFIPTEMLLFIESVDKLSKYGAKLISSLL